MAFDVGEFVVPVAVFGVVGYGTGRILMGRRSGKIGAVLGAGIGAAGAAMAQKRAASGKSPFAAKLLDKIDVTRGEDDVVRASVYVNQEG